jgi:hypothetical protein
MNIPVTLDEDRGRRAVRLLEAAGIRSPLRWKRLGGGANNQVFRVDRAGDTVLLKAYFVHPEDPRDRLGAEFRFAQFAWNHGVRMVPWPIARDEYAKLALFEYLRGRRLRPCDVTRIRVREALDFVLAINAYRRADGAQELPAASEACFTLSAHLDCVRRRVARLQSIEAASPVDLAARTLVRGELSELGSEVLDHACRCAADLGMARDEPLPAHDRCLSPSDFGFHNALRMEDGRLKFIDFEYAGWDDPAKLVAEFFAQPRCPVPSEYFDEFAAALAKQTARPDLCVRRCRLLWPVYRLKWCCIMLNDFLPAGERRRRFANGGGDEDQRKARQLARARRAMRRLVREAGLIAARR